VRPEAPPSELAVAVARHFEQMDVDEEECIGGFLERLEQGSTGVTDYARSTAHFDGRALHSSVRKRKRNKLAARPGEQASKEVMHACIVLCSFVVVVVLLYCHVVLISCS
jgi:hypothetical protein